MSKEKDVFLEKLLKPMRALTPAQAREVNEAMDVLHKYQIIARLVGYIYREYEEKYGVEVWKEYEATFRGQLISDITGRGN